MQFTNLEDESYDTWWNQSAHNILDGVCHSQWSVLSQKLFKNI